jgi:hypothetical protein
MNSARIPGFSAAASCYRRSGYSFRAAVAPDLGRSVGVVPARRMFGCDFTPGGAYCCNETVTEGTSGHHTTCCNDGSITSCATVDW